VVDLRAEVILHEHLNVHRAAEGDALPLGGSIVSGDPMLGGRLLLARAHCAGLRGGGGSGFFSIIQRKNVVVAWPG
jgi:hypothetical protein